MSIKTFPLVMTAEQHEEIKKATFKTGESMKDFIFEAIRLRLEALK